MSVSEVSIASSSVDCLTTISGTDLDEMFLRNLQLLKSIEENESSSISSKLSSRRYHSSLNVFITPKGSMRHSDGICYSYCNIAPNSDSKNSEEIDSRNSCPMNASCKLTKTFSSYETLYDNLISDPVTLNKHNDPKPPNQCAKERTRSSLSNILQIDTDHYSDSDKTLKSLSSEDISSSISSLESPSDSQEIPFVNKNKSLIQLSNSYIPKLRSLKIGNTSRPTSCYVDTKFGRYSSSRYPSRPDMVLRINGEPCNRSNFVISKPLGSYPSRFSNSFASVNDGIINNRINNLNASPFDANFVQYVPVDTVPHLPIYNRNRSYSNILNNHSMKK